MSSRRDFICSSGFAEVCTHCGTHRKAPPRRQRGRLHMRSALLATLIGTALALVLFLGLSGGFRP